VAEILNVVRLLTWTVLMPTRFVAFDVETTGLFVEKSHRIIEVGAVSVEGDVMGEEFQSLICCNAPISKARRRYMVLRRRCSSASRKSKK